MDRAILDRFWEKVDVCGEDECWNWNAGINSTGRGIFAYKRKSIHAHRMSWIIHHGSIPKGKLICHHCDNGKCVNPKHLFMGTYTDNVHDMISKGRQVILRGEDDPKSKLTEKQVLKIRELYIPFEVSQFKLADMFGVSRTTIQSILNRSNWKHI